MSSALWKSGQRQEQRARVNPAVPDRVHALRQMRQFVKLCELADRKRSRVSGVNPQGFLIQDEEANARTFMRELREQGYSTAEVKCEIDALTD
jgi:hypothetical protein